MNAVNRVGVIRVGSARSVEEPTPKGKETRLCKRTQTSSAHAKERNSNRQLHPALRALPILLAGALIFGGCGGSSGGSGTTGSGPSSVTYRSYWSGAGVSNFASQLLSVFDLSDRLVLAQVLNRASTAVNETGLPNVPQGSYILKAELFSEADARGTKLGELRLPVTVTSGTVVETEATQQVSSVSVSPSTGNLQVNQSRAFTAYPIASTGRPSFLNGAFTWTTSGGVATVNSSGVVFGTAPGTGRVRASVSGGPFGESALVVSPPNTRVSKWTVLVYLNAANDLHVFSDLNMRQMSSVAQNQDVRFVVQWKQSRILFPASSFNGTRRYLVKPGVPTALDNELVQDLGDGVDMGLPTTLFDFVRWGKTFYPAERYVLVIWNHGNGWRRSLPGADYPTRNFSYDDETGSSIGIHQLGTALGGEQFDVVAWDCSLMQMVEAAYELKDNARFVVGSEESPPGEGYPYDTIFGVFRDNPDRSTRDLTKSFVDGMLAVPSYQDKKITQSSIDTARLPAVASAVRTLGQQLIANRAAIASQVQSARSTSQSYSPTAFRVFRDIIDLMNKLEAAPGMPASVVSASASVRSATASAVVWEGHNALSPRSNGLSIDFSSGSQILSQLNHYRQMRFAQDTQWADWLSVAP